MKRSVTQAELDTPLIPYEDARRRVLDAFSPLPRRAHDLSEAVGLVCAEDVVSPIDVPGFASSAMDGYAVRRTDVEHASRDNPVAIHAHKIMTGWEIPVDADAIVPWEDTDRGDETVTVYAAPKPGGFVRPAGEDIRAGRLIIGRGDVLDAVRLGVLASVGRERIDAHPRPVVSIASTGDELATPGEDLPRGHMYDANATLLSALASTAGATVHETARLPDDPRAIAAWLASAARASDLIVTSGGASVGEHDFIRDVLDDITMWRVAVKPGKPIALGTTGGTPVIVLPGNPGSAFAGTHCFVIPAIRRMLGRDPSHRTVTKRLSEAVKGSPSRTQLTRVAVDGHKAKPLPAQSSVVLSNLIGADGFAIVPPGGLDEGATVTVELFER